MRTKEVHRGLSQGQTYGHRTVLGVPFKRTKHKNGWAVVVECSCGKVDVVDVMELKEGRATSFKKCMGDRNVKHGDNRGYARTYRIWAGMLARCRNPNHAKYYMYGARGIFVCTEWLDYPAFKEWALANGYADNLSIDRREGDGPYAPWNCRWATAKEQAQNTRLVKNARGRNVQV